MKTFTDQRLKDDLKRFNSSLRPSKAKVEMVIFVSVLIIMGVLFIMSI